MKVKSRNIKEVQVRREGGRWERRGRRRGTGREREGSGPGCGAAGIPSSSNKQAAFSPNPWPLLLPYGKTCILTSVTLKSLKQMTTMH